MTVQHVETPQEPVVPGRERQWGRRLGGALLNIAALGGAVCIVLVILSAVFNISLIMFKTGSMSPTIPAGSLAVVREISAQEIAVGDVVTVDRVGMLPVTHRVTSVEGSGETRTITMRGDANEAEDPAPYTVTDVRIVLGSVPGLAYVVVWFSNPWVLGSLTIGASVLVTWAFWPRDPGGSRRSRPRHVAREPRRGRERERERERHRDRVGTGVVVAAICLVLAVWQAPHAEAVPGPAPIAAERSETVITGEHMTLTSVGDPEEMLAMRARAPVHWQVGITTDAPEPGRVSVAIDAAGSRDLGLNLEIRSCTERWSGDTCAGSEQLLQRPSTANVGEGFVSIVTFPDIADRWILITALIPEPASGTVALTLRVDGSGESVEVRPGPIGVLPETGKGLGNAVLLGLGALGLGLCAAAIATARQRSREARPA